MPNDTFPIPSNFFYVPADLRVAFFRNGNWDFDWADDELGDLASRIRVEEVETGINTNYPKAKVVVNMSPKTSNNEVLSAGLSFGSALDLIPPDTRCCVYGEIPKELPGGGTGTRTFLFEGYPKVSEATFSGLSDFQEYMILCTSLMERLAREQKSWICGRYMLAADGFSIQLCQSLPCIFNFDNKPGHLALKGNRHPNLQTYTIGDKTIDNVPIFTYDGDPNGKFWTYGECLKYLTVFYLMTLGENYPLQDGNGVDLCSSSVGLTAPVDFEDADDLTFKAIASSKCNEIAAEGHNFTTAVQAWAKSTGCCVQQWTTNKGDGTPQTRLIYNYTGDGGPFKDGDTANRTLRSADDDTPMAAGALQLQVDGDVTVPGVCQSDVVEGRILVDSSSVLAECTVFGTVKKYEVTTGRTTTSTDMWRPGWKPDTLFGDSLPSGSTEISDKLNNIGIVGEESDPTFLQGDQITMFNRYVKKGSDHYKYEDVGRLWLLDEAGELVTDAASYNRTNNAKTIWNTTLYQTPYDFHVNCQVPKIADDQGNLTIPWTRRRRKILELLSQKPAPNDQDREPKVECSWDSGSHWYPYPGHVKFIKDQCALYLMDENLASDHLAQPNTNGVGDTIWAAIVKGNFKLAVTFTVESDERVSSTSPAASDAFTTFVPHFDVHTHDQFRFEKRQNSNLIGNVAYAFTDLDETSRTLTTANRIVGVGKARLVGGNFKVPWISIDWMPGDICTGLSPRGTNFATTKSDTPRYPQVVAVKWTSNEHNVFTEITVDDLRTAIRKSSLAEGGLS